MRIHCSSPTCDPTPSHERQLPIARAQVCSKWCWSCLACIYLLPDRTPFPIYFEQSSQPTRKSNHLENTWTFWESMKDLQLVQLLMFSLRPSKLQNLFLHRLYPCFLIMTGLQETCLEGPCTVSVSRRWLLGPASERSSVVAEIAQPFQIIPKQVPCACLMLLITWQEGMQGSFSSHQLPFPATLPHA